MISWDTCRQDFEPDGALRDIYVYDITMEHWRLLYRMMCADYRVEHSVNQQPQPVPASVDEIFALSPECGPILWLHLDCTGASCHFFSPEEIELSIAPWDIVSQETLDTLLDFVKRVGDTVGKNVTLTYENDRQRPIISYEPSSGAFCYHASMVG